jgi:tRNA(Arg) A34 adenosine deaminase TadA
LRPGLSDKLAGQDRDCRFMEIAVKEAYRAVECGDDGPFGAVVVRDGEVVVSWLGGTRIHLHTLK